MKAKYLLMALAFTATVSTTAMAESNTPPAGAAMEQHKPMMMDHDKKPHQEQNFEQRKAEMLKRMEKRMAEMQKKQACVQAAANPEAMKACFPNRGKWKQHGEKGGHGEGGNHGPNGPSEGSDHGPEPDDGKE